MREREGRRRTEEEGERKEREGRMGRKKRGRERGGEERGEECQVDLFKDDYHYVTTWYNHKSIKQVHQTDDILFFAPALFFFLFFFLSFLPPLLPPSLLIFLPLLTFMLLHFFLIWN